MKFLLILTLTVICLANVSEGANILFFFGISTYSHRITVWPLVQKLAANGHNVTFFSPHSPKHPVQNVIEFSPKKLYEKIKLDLDFLNIRLEKGSEEVHKMRFLFAEMGIEFCKNVVSDPEVLAWVNNSQYDLVFVDAIYNDCALGLAYKFKAKHIIYGTTSQFSWWPDTYSFSDESATYPEHTLHFPQKMSFYQRIRNSLRPLYWHFFNIFYYYPAIEKSLKNGLDIPDLPPLEEMQKKTSLIFLNTHFSDDYSRSYPPSVVPIGGMHCTDKNNNLPKDIIDFIDGAGNNAVVYISFGSVIQYSKIPENLRRIFVNTFKKLSPTRFLWKFDGERPENFPSNVFTRSWLPQQDILAHPKINAFISHGGKLGIQEAIFHAVPMIVIPIFAEQDYNAEKMNSHGSGIRLEITDLTETEFESTVTKILTDTRTTVSRYVPSAASYTQKMQKMSKIFRDRPSKPVDTALWWTEYVLRHENTLHLHSYSNQQPWYERRLIDVWIFLFSASVITILLLFVMLKRIVRFLIYRKIKLA